MKKFLFSAIVACFCFVMNAQALNPQQTKLRDDIQNFLNEEGFRAEIDSDGDIKFKREGLTWFVVMSSTDVDPMFIVLMRMHPYGEITKENLTPILNEINSWKGVKIYFGEKSYSYRAELYVNSAEPFKAAFYKLASQIDNMSSDVISILSNANK